MTILKAANTNEICNSTCQTSLNCSQMWSLYQYNAIYLLRKKTSLLTPRAKFEYRQPINNNFIFNSQNPQLRVEEIAKAYAKMFLEQYDFSNPKQQGRFYWIGLGAFAAKQVYCGIMALDDFFNKKGASTAGMLKSFGIQSSEVINDFSEITPDDFRYLSVLAQT